MNTKSLARIATISASFAILLTAFAGVSASADGLANPKQFAVEMTMTSDMGESAGQSMVMKFYVGKDRIRMEMSMGGMGGGGGTGVRTRHSFTFLPRLWRPLFIFP